LSSSRSSPLCASSASKTLGSAGAADTEIQQFYIQTQALLAAQERNRKRDRTEDQKTKPFHHNFRAQPKDAMLKAVR
jgi:hypothetical protein